MSPSIKLNCIFFCFVVIKKNYTVDVIMHLTGRLLFFGFVMMLCRFSPWGETWVPGIYFLQLRLQVLP